MAPDPRILVTADLHLSDNPRDRYRLEFQKQLRAIVKKHKVEMVLILGDLTEEKDRHGAWLVNRIVEAMVRLAKLCPVVIIRGNHDYVDVSAPFYTFLRHVPGITWVNVPTEAKDLPLPLLQRLGRVLLFPHGSDPLQSDRERFDWVFTHQTFQGAHVGHGQQMRGLPLDTFGKAAVISGDIHVPQMLGKMIHYVGAPYTVDFGDKYQPRVLLLRDRGKELGKKKAWTVASIPVSGPQKRLVELGSVGELKHHPTVNTKYCNPGDILKVRVLIDAKQKADWANIRQTVREWGAKQDFIIHTVEPVMLESIRGTNKKKVRKSTAKTDKELLAAYVKARGIEPLTAKMGFKLLETV